MTDLTLSQEEIESLLNQTEVEPEPDVTNEAMPALTKLLYAAMLTASGALEMSLGVDVKAQPPVDARTVPIAEEELVITPVKCSGEGLDGQMHLLVSVPIARQLVDLMRGMGSEAEALSETELMTLAEVFEDVVSEFATHLSSVAGQTLSMEVGETFMLEQAEYGTIVEQVDPRLQLAYPLVVGEDFQVYLEHWVSAPLAQFLDKVTQKPPAPSKRVEGPSPPSTGAVEVKAPAFGQLAPGPETGERSNLDMLYDIPLEITVELGRTRRNVRDVLSLGAGSVLELEKVAGEPVDVMVNGKLLAKGEVVVIDENFGVRITEIVTQAERVRRLGG